MDHYIYRQVDITGWQGTMYLKLDWRARSNWAYSTVTNARVDFYDGSQSLGSITLVAGGTYDTGWTYGQVFDVTSMLAGRSSVQVRLRIQDGWIAYWAQQAWFDNVKLYSTGYNHPPDTPNSPSPASGTNETSRSLNLTWSCSDPDPGDSVAYHHVYFGTSPDPALNATITTNTLPKSNLSEGTTYYWKIVAEDEYGANTTGPVWNFTTGYEPPPNDPPYAPSKPSPPDGATRQAASLTLSWSGGDPNGNETVNYHVYLDLYSPPMNYVGLFSDTSIYITGLYHGTTYYWQIVSQDTGGKMTEGDVWSFTTNRPPNSPSDPSPQDWATVPRPVVDMDWTCTDPDGDSLTYRVYLDEANPPATLIYEGGDSSCTIGERGYRTTYYWRVLADDGVDTTEGPVWWFKVTMGYGYMQVIDSGTGEHYGVPETDQYHIQTAASQSNLIVIPDKIYDSQSDWYNENYPVIAVENGLGIILDVHTTLRWLWFDSGWEDGDKETGATTELTKYKNKLTNSGAYGSVRAVWLFDEPISFYDGNQMNLSKLTTMRNIAESIYGGKPLFLNFYRVGNQRAGSFYFWEDNTASYYTAAVEDGVLKISKTGTGMGVQNVTSSSIYSLGEWKGSDPDVYLSLRYKAVCDVASGNNAYVELLDEWGTILHTFPLVEGGTANTGWVDWPAHDVTSYVQGPDGLINSVKIRVWVQDYSENCMHQVYFDNVWLYPDPEPNAQPMDWFDPFDYDNIFASYDAIASNYIIGDDWVGIDPYVYPLYPRGDTNTYYPHYCIDQDITWATGEMSSNAKLIIFGQAYDPPENMIAPFFEEDNNQTGSQISPGDYTLEYYYNHATESAIALVWFWYPDSYASSFYHDPDLVVNNMWAKQQEFWGYLAP